MLFLFKVLALITLSTEYIYRTTFYSLLLALTKHKNSRGQDMKIKIQNKRNNVRNITKNKRIHHQMDMYFHIELISNITGQRSDRSEERRVGKECRL